MSELLTGVRVGDAKSASNTLQAVDTAPLAQRIDQALDETFQAVEEAEKHLLGLHVRLFGLELPNTGQSSEPTKADGWGDAVTNRLRLLNQQAGRVQYLSGLVARRI